MGVSAATVVSYVSLVIAITAFFLSMIQTTQQFAATADGYRRCKRRIMGDWSRNTRRKFTAEEFRFKVLFTTPVIFVAKPDNPYGPLKGREVINVTGDRKSYDATHCRIPQTMLNEHKHGLLGDHAANKSLNRGVHTTDDELATWVVLLETLQKAEREGREWDSKASPISVKEGEMPGVRMQSPMVVQLQKKQRDWDEMPDEVQKPFATTNISHITEMCVLLGMVWKNFNQNDWSMRAEGNGMMVHSESVRGLGISVSFAITGKTRFEEQRSIPCPALKELMYGTVHSRYADMDLQFEPNNKDISEQHLIRRTLRHFHCDRRTAEHWFQRRSHIRSVAFELVAMTSEVVRLRNSSFKRIPNPTPDVWRKTLSACTLMQELANNLNSMSSAQAHTLRAIWIDRLRPVWAESEDKIGIELREAAHDAIESCDKFLQSQLDITLSVIGAHLSVVLKEINTSTSLLSSHKCDSEALLFEAYFQKVRPDVVEFVDIPQSAVNSTQSPWTTTPATETISSPLTAGSRVEREDIWLTLMFRMCCWWLIHDFDETDTLILPPSLKGSRLPVYIL